MTAPKKKKKVDTVAVNSPFARIPGFRPQFARALIDLGMREIYELQGRSPDALYAELQDKRGGEAPEDALGYFRLAVYYAENVSPEPAKLSPQYWQDTPY